MGNDTWQSCYRSLRKSICHRARSQVIEKDHWSQSKVPHDVTPSDRGSADGLTGHVGNQLNINHSLAVVEVVAVIVVVVVILGIFSAGLACFASCVTSQDLVTRPWRGMSS